MKFVKLSSEVIGGQGGGGRKDFAQAGGQDQSKINEAFDKIKTLMKSPVIFDGRNLYNKQKMKDIGFYYSNIGFHPENEKS